MSNRLALVGLAPPAPGALAMWPSNPNDAPARLIGLMDCTMRQYGACFERFNLHDRPLDGTEPSDRDAAVRLIDEFENAGHSIVVLGSRAWRALGLPREAPLYAHGVFRSVHDRRLLDATLWPHPSGRNRQWNETDFSEMFRLRARARLRRQGLVLPEYCPANRMEEWPSARDVEDEIDGILEALEDPERDLCEDRVAARKELIAAWEHGYRGAEARTGKAVYQRRLKRFVTQGQLPPRDSTVLQWIEASSKYLR